VLVAAGATTLVSGVAWLVGGFLTSTLVSVAVAMTLDQPVRTGWGPALVLGIYVIAFVMLTAIQVSARRKIPNLEALEAQTRLAAVEENLQAKVTAAVHDTLLNDLALIMNSPEVLDERVTSRLKQDVATLTGAEWLRESSEVVVDAQTSALLNRFMQLVSDLQWRGLTVEVTGVGSGIYSLDPAVATALVEAVQACLENALLHSGVSVAELDLAFSDEAVTAIVADHGRGFDPASIPPDRLGVRHSVIERIEAVGGTARVWSSPEEGTSIVLSVPVLKVIAHHEESDHGSAT
jgi:signal transduction histidine kinase